MFPLVDFDWLQICSEETKIKTARSRSIENLTFFSTEFCKLMKLFKTAKAEVTKCSSSSSLFYTKENKLKVLWLEVDADMKIRMYDQK